MKDKVGLARKLYRKMLYRDIDKVYAKHFDLRQMPRKKRKVLDVGMGFGFDLIKKSRQGYECYGFDNDKARVKKTVEMFKKHGVKATLKVGTATRIPFGSGTFDEVICSHVIEHVMDDKKCLKEIYRVMKKGGRLYLRVPNLHNLHTVFHTKIGSKSPFTDKTHFREYDKTALLNLIKYAGFKVKSVGTAGFFLPVGLKFFMVASHYMPSDKLMVYLGRKYPHRSAEIKVLAVK